MLAAAESVRCTVASGELRKLGPWEGGGLRALALLLPGLQLMQARPGDGPPTGCCRYGQGVCGGGVSGWVLWRETEAKRRAKAPLTCFREGPSPNAIIISSFVARFLMVKSKPQMHLLALLLYGQCLEYFSMYVSD